MGFINIFTSNFVTGILLIMINFQKKISVALDPSVILLVYSYIRIQGVPGGIDKTSGECSLC